MLFNKLAPMRSRIRFWRSICYGLADFRFARLRPVKTLGNQLDTFNNRILSRIIALKPRSDDSAESFCVHRNHVIKQLKEECSFSMRSRWCMKVVGWVEHIRRHQGCTSFCFLISQGDDWLRERRREAGGLGRMRTLESGETRTRMGAGHPNRFATIWLEQLDMLCGGVCENPQRQKSVTKQHAEDLYSLIFEERSLARLALTG